MQYAESILDLVGGHAARPPHPGHARPRPAGPQPLILAKLEMLNPGGSVKDRIGLPMIEAAERAGLLKPGGTIIEPTIGNTGHGLAIAAALKGYRCIFVMADKQSTREAGAPAGVRRGGRALPDERRARVARSRTTPSRPAWRATSRAPSSPTSTGTTENPNAHERTTGPEIWDQTDGRITHLVASAGTGGTITGVGALPAGRRTPAITVVGADPEGSVLSGDTARPYLTEGVGEDFFPGTYDPSGRRPLGPRLGPRRVRHGPPDHPRGGDPGRRVVRDGGRGRARRGPPDHGPRRRRGREAVMVVILPDGGRNYLSKLYNDEWMRANGLLATTGAVVRVGELLARPPPRSGSARTSSWPGRPSASARRSTRSSAYGISQMPVSEAADGDAPRRASWARSASRASSIGPTATRTVVERTVGEVMDRPLPTVDDRRPRSTRRSRCSPAAPAALAVRGGRPAGVVTKLDLLEYLAHHRAEPVTAAARPASTPGAQVPTVRHRCDRRPRRRLAFETLAVHAGQEPDELTGAVAPADLPDQHLRPGRRRTGRAAATTTRGPRTRRASGSSGRSRRSRAAGRGSPSRRARPRRRRSPSWRRPATEIVVGDDVYGGTYRYLERVAAPSGVDARYVDLAGDPDALWEALTERTRLVWFETPTNPLLKVIDIARRGASDPRAIRRTAADRPLARRRQHLRLAGPPAAARPRRRHRLPLGDEVPRRPQRHGPRHRRDA